MDGKITIGYSDYSRKEIESGNTGLILGVSAESFMDAVTNYERWGYTVRFETNLLRKIFGMGKYKVTITPTL